MTLIVTLAGKWQGWPHLAPLYLWKRFIIYMELFTVEISYNKPCTQYID